MSTYQVITDRIIAKLESGAVPWRQPWSGTELGQCKNLMSQKPYRGINAFMTSLCGYRSPYFLSYKQAIELGANVRKGEKGIPIVYAGSFEKEGDAGKDPKQVRFLKYSTVFSVEQVEGLKLKPEWLFPETVREFQPIEACERIRDNNPMTSVRIQHAEPRAFYAPILDYINMPHRELFDRSETYYATLFHEMTHATGHTTRLNRGLDTKLAAFGSGDYSKEELIAEMGSAFLCSKAGIDPVTLDQSASYIASWLKVLKGDPKLVIQAAAQAQKAADYLTGVQS